MFIYSIFVYDLILVNCYTINRNLYVEVIFCKYHYTKCTSMCDAPTCTPTCTPTGTPTFTPTGKHLH